MVNYHDPVVVLQDNLAASKIWHAVAGLYFWEFVTTLDFEWSVIRGHRPFRWTIWIYSTTRIFTLISVILALVGVDVTGRYNCEVCHDPKVRAVFLFFSGYLAIACASLLIVLRILAIWNKKKIIIAIAAGAWGINVIFEIQSIVRIRATRVPGASCLVPNLHISELNILVTLATDIILLLIMFFGLLRLGFHERGAFELGRLLWKQVGYWCFSLAVLFSAYTVVRIHKGVIWLLVATIAEVLPAVFFCLNLNEPFNFMFLPPSMVTLSIAATRIHRCLVDHASGYTEHLSGPDSSERSGRIEWKANRVPITLSRMEVAINRTSDQDQTPQTSQSGSLAYIEGQLCEKPGRQRRLDESAENDVESQTQVSSVT
ncbi:hypothetical protein F5888DRAFT_1886812 [Russula emetica]|nr:hypothetical protein F5888DRAFT_1886812 [Russula emetica]